MDDYSPTEIKRCSFANPIKQAHRIAGKTILVIHESLVRDFKLDEHDTWFEQITTKEGILLKPIRDGSLNSVGNNRT